jgi:hypothetical protein
MPRFPLFFVTVLAALASALAIPAFAAAQDVHQTGQETAGKELMCHFENGTYTLSNNAAQAHRSHVLDRTPTANGDCRFDTTAPVIGGAQDLSVAATGLSEIVSYQLNATDDFDGAVAVTCSPASGSAFAVGSTAVMCSATDAAGNTATASFTVTVTQAVQTLAITSAAAAGHATIRITGTGLMQLGIIAPYFSNGQAVAVGNPAVHPNGAQININNGNTLISWTDTEIVVANTLSPYGVTFDGKTVTHVEGYPVNADQPAIDYDGPDFLVP